jgi:hypothetical protein
MRQSGGLSLAPGWTGATPSFSPGENAIEASQVHPAFTTQPGGVFFGIGIH